MIIETILKYIPDGKVNYVEGGFDKRNYKNRFHKSKKHFDFTTQWNVEERYKGIDCKYEKWIL